MLTRLLASSQLLGSEAAVKQVSSALTSVPTARSNCTSATKTTPTRATAADAESAAVDVTATRMSVQDLLSEYSALSGGGQIRLEKDDETGIAIIRIEHERRRNAISGPMVAMLGEAIFELEKWTRGRGVILWGGPRTFSSGVDLDTVRQLIASTTGGGCFSTVMHQLLTRLLNMPLVSVAVINGKALGGGAELATACDFRLMAEGSNVHFVHKRMGVTTGWGGGPRLVNQVGRALSLEMLVGGRELRADEALQVGYASGGRLLSPGEQALDEARDWLRQMVHGDLEVVRAMKQLVADTQESTSFGQSLMAEKKLFARLFGGPAQLKALQENLKH